MPQKNMYDFMEQDALWYLKESDSDDRFEEMAKEGKGPYAGIKHTDKAREYNNLAQLKEKQFTVHTVNSRGIINNGYNGQLNWRGESATFQYAKQAEAFKKNTYNYSINSTNMALIYEPQFQSNFHGAHDMQFIHIANYVEQKMSYLSVALKDTSMDGEKDYMEALDHIMQYHYLHMDIVGLTEKIEVTKRYRNKEDIKEGGRNIRTVPFEKKPFESYAPV